MTSDPRNRQYFRTAPHIRMKEHAVAFLDVLGFKNHLESGDFGLLRALFEELSDTVYRQYRFAYLAGTDPLFPKIVSFSDSIILLAPTHPEYAQLPRAVINMVIGLCAGLVSTALNVGVPIRGGLSVGELFMGDAEPVRPVSVIRYGAGRVFNPLITETLGPGAYNQSPYDTGRNILPGHVFPIHMGSALTTAYVIEQQVNSIGVFVQPGTLPGDLEDEMIGFERLRKCTVDGQILLSVNWKQSCESQFGWDAVPEILDFAQQQYEATQGRVQRKWETFVKCWR